MRKLALVVALVAVRAAFFVEEANAHCVCRCVNGSVQPICSSEVDLPPICAPIICPIVPPSVTQMQPSVTPMQPAIVPPIGTSFCSLQQVPSPYTNQYEWRRVCQ